MTRSPRWRDNGNQQQHERFPLRLPLLGHKKACRDRQASSVADHWSD
jgi:hypothetical protein